MTTSNRPDYAYELDTTGEKIAAVFGIWLELPVFEPSSEVLPAQISPVVHLTQSGERKCVLARWGLAPYRSADTDTNIGSRRFTARAETIASGPAFRTAFKQRRCLVPATGFCELAGRSGRKIKRRLALPGGKLMAIAGVWDIWHDRAGKRGDTYTIITSEPRQQSRPGFARVPVIIKPRDFDTWLRQPSIDLLTPYDGKLVIRQTNNFD